LLLTSILVQGLYLSDIQDHITTSTQNLMHYEKILSRSHSNYLAQISIEMTDANNQINDVLSKLTALGTILIPVRRPSHVFLRRQKLTWYMGR
jgi:magnesium transporter